MRLFLRRTTCCPTLERSAFDLKKTEGATNNGAIKLALKIGHPARHARRIQQHLDWKARFSATAEPCLPAPSQATEEEIMKKLQLAALMVLCLSSAASAQSTLSHRHHRRAPAAPVAEQYSAMMPSAPAPSGVTHNANDCAPDHPEAVWGAGGALLGYSCVTPNAN